MVKVTFDDAPELKKTHFKNVAEFVVYVEEHCPVELKEVLEEEITPEMRRKIDESQKKPLSEFINI